MGRGRLAVVGLVAGCLLGWLAGPAVAGQPAPVEDRLRDAALRIERAAAGLPEAEAASRLAQAFRVKPRLVLDLHDQKLDFGEVALVLALAELGKSPSDRILSLWATGRLSWSQIAERLAVEPRGLLKRLDGLRRELARRP